VSSLLKTSLKSLQKHSTKLTTASTTLDEFDNELTAKIEKENTLVEGVIDDLDKLQRLHSAYEYFRNICDIQDISNELTACHSGKDAVKIVNLYLSLCGDYESSNSCLGRLNDVDAPHLKLYARSMSFYWHEVLKEKFSKEFESQLKAIKWPPMGLQALEVYSPAKDAVAKLQTTAESLFMVSTVLISVDFPYHHGMIGLSDKNPGRSESVARKNYTDHCVSLPAYPN
jgi:RAD50-interacting protein 1